MSATATPQQMSAFVGGAPFVSGWVRIDQARIDAFADVTEDHQFIHVDPERAAQTPFGGTVAHGFLTLSMLSAMVPLDLPQLADAAMGVNYGFDRVRFVEPVRAGSRIRSAMTLKAFEERRAGQYQSRWGVSVEIEGNDKPALLADWLTLTIVG